MNSLWGGNEVMIEDIDLLGVNINSGGISTEFIPLLNLESLFAKQLKEIKQIKLDLELAKSSFFNINRLEDCEENYFLKHSLWFTGAITYSRCFNSGDGRGIKLNKKKYINNLPIKFIEAHDELISQRNKYFAHADVNDYEQNEVFGALDFDSNKILGISNFFSRTIALNKEKPEVYSELVTKILEQVVQLENSLTKLLLSELEKMPIEQKNIINPNSQATTEVIWQFYYLIAKKYFEKKDFINTISFLSKAINIDQNIKELYLNRAIAYKEIGDLQKYVQDITKASEL
jgi:tetratricopeptide (TPR) repeat protein